MNILLAGPNGVGKTTVGEILAPLVGATFIDFDELRGRYAHADLAFSAGHLDLLKCLPAIRAVTSIDFVLAIGGDTVFRRDKNNDERLADVRSFKQETTATIVVLTAVRESLLARFLCYPARTHDEFNALWTEWTEIVESYWKLCSDLWIDTSGMLPDQVAAAIGSTLQGRLS